MSLKIIFPKTIILLTLFLMLSGAFAMVEGAPINFENKIEESNWNNIFEIIEESSEGLAVRVKCGDVVFGAGTTRQVLREQDLCETVYEKEPPSGDIPEDKGQYVPKPVFNSNQSEPQRWM